MLYRGIPCPADLASRSLHSGALVRHSISCMAWRRPSAVSTSASNTTVDLVLFGAKSAALGRPHHEARSSCGSGFSGTTSKLPDASVLRQDTDAGIEMPTGVGGKSKDTIKRQNTVTLFDAQVGPGAQV
jgi:hypothetical protein